MATEHEMWAVVNWSGSLIGFGHTKNDAKFDALIDRSGITWKYVKKHYGWRVVPVTVTVPDEGER